MGLYWKNEKRRSLPISVMLSTLKHLTAFRVACQTGGAQTLKLTAITVLKNKCFLVKSNCVGLKIECASRGHEVPSSRGIGFDVLGSADDKLEGFVTWKWLIPAKLMSRWNIFQHISTCGLLEGSLNDGKFFCLHYY